jgi:hypothetical protein
MATTRQQTPPEPHEVLCGTTTLRPLADWPGFFAGDDGHVYRQVKGVIRRLQPLKNRKLAYATVTLYRDDIRYPRKSQGGKTYWCKRPSPQYVHLLVAAAWLPPKPGPEHTIDHENEDKYDNRPANLRWLTGEQNTFAYYRNHPLVVSGERNGFAKLTDDAARQLLGLRGTVTQRMAADLFKISVTTVGGIWRGERWRHLKGAGQN